MFKLLPKPGYIVVEPIPTNEFNKSSLADTTDEKDKISTGRVLVVGGDALFENHDGVEFPPSCDVGEFIVYKTFSEQRISIDNKEYALVRFDHIIAEIKEK